MQDIPIQHLEQSKFIKIWEDIVVKSFLYNTDIAKDTSLWVIWENILASNALLSQVEGGVIDVKSALQAYSYAEDSPHTSGDTWVLILWLRSDEDDATADNGDYTIMKLDEKWRLKVASMSASYSDITGNITAIQTNIWTPVVWGTVVGDVSRASNVMMFCTGTFSAVNCAFEWSLESTWETNWFSVQAVRSNANTIETTTWSLSAQPVYAWELSVNGLKRIRVRCTALWTGVQSWRFVLWTYATEPIPAAQTTGIQAISWSVTSLPGTPATTTGYSTHSSIVSAANTNATLVKAWATVVGSMQISNSSTSWRYVKLYDKVTAPVVWDSSAIKKNIGVPPGDTLLLNFSTHIRFALGLGMRITANPAVSDDTAIGANEVIVNISYV